MTAVPLQNLLNDNAATSHSRTHALRWLLLISFCITTALIARLVYLVRIFDADGAMFIYMGKLTSEGGRICHDLIDNKFPTVGLVTSVPWRIMGANWSGYVLLGMVLSGITALMLARISRRHIGEHATLPVLLFSLVYLNFTSAVFGGFQLETMQVFFATLGACAAAEAIKSDDPRDTFVLGLCAGCAAMLKPTGLAVLGAFAVTTIINLRARPVQRTMLHCIAALAGLAIVAAVVLSYLIAADTLRDMPSLARQISRYAAQSAWNHEDLFKIPVLVILLGFPFLVRGRIFRSRQYRCAIPLNRTIVLFICTWVLFEIVGVVSQRRMYAYHFLVIAPPLALLFGNLPRTTDPKVLAAALVPTALLSMVGAGTVLQYQYRHEKKLPETSYLLAHTSPGDSIWKDEMMRLLIETGLRPASRIPMSFLFANYDEAPLEYSSIILNDFERTKPKYILLRTDLDRHVEHQTRHIAELERVPRRRENFILAWKRIRAYVEQNYRAETMLGKETLYRRIDRERNNVR